MNIVLIGYRGCGKTTVGKALAERLSYRFIDLDDEICDRYGGMSIRAIWDQLGEGEFRATEAATLVELLQGDRQVLSLGGGAVIQPAGRKVVERAENVRRFYLEASPEVLRKRIVADATRADRPSTGTNRNSIEFITDELADREPIYEAVADETVPTDEMNIEQIVDAIMTDLSEDG